MQLYPCRHVMGIRDFRPAIFGHAYSRIGGQSPKIKMITTTASANPNLQLSVEKRKGLIPSRITFALFLSNNNLKFQERPNTHSSSFHNFETLCHNETANEIDVKLPTQKKSTGYIGDTPRVSLLLRSFVVPSESSALMSTRVLWTILSFTSWWHEFQTFLLNT